MSAGFPRRTKPLGILAAAGEAGSRAARQRDLALAILEARRAIRRVLDAASSSRASSSAAAAMSGQLIAVMHALQNVEDKARVRGAVVDLSAVKTLCPCCCGHDAQALAESCRRGEPLLLDLAGMADNDARHLAEFAATRSVDLGGGFERAGYRQMLLLPPTAVSASAVSRRDVGLIFALDDLEYLSQSLGHVLAGRGALSWERVLPNIARAVSPLRPDKLPLDVSGVDLSGADLSGADLSGAVWTSATVWPDAVLAAGIRESSNERRPGVFEVTARRG